jgi:hypothetical protein
MHEESRMSFDVTCSGLSSVKLYDSFTGELLGEKSELDVTQVTHFSLESQNALTKTGFRKVMMEGFRNNEQFVKTYRYLRIIPALKDYIELGVYLNFNWDFEPHSAVAIYNSPATKEKDGWQLDAENRQLVIGNGTAYENNVDSQVSIFVNVPVDRNPIVALVADYDTEKDCDFFTVGYVRSNGTFAVLFRGSGIGSVNDEFELTEGLNATTEIVLKFVSDPFVVSKGVRIQSLIISP